MANPNPTPDPAAKSDSKSDAMSNRGSTLLAIARGSIASALGAAAAAPGTDRSEEAAWLDEPGATFVTLLQQAELRGCIGSLQAHRPLREDVAQNALGAAFRDPRFEPLQAHEFELTAIEVSVLTAPQPLPVRDEAEAIARLRPHLDGVILAAGPYRSTFLPQVWEDLPDPMEFLAHLKRKAGLPARGWMPGTQLSVYQVTKHAESPRRRAP